MKKNYVCSICGRKNVKLWRPYIDEEPLICATCAEERQSPREYSECIWERRGGHYIGTPSGRTLLLPKWKVNEYGKIPSYFGPDHSGINKENTNQLIVNLKNVSKAYPSGETIMIPAVPNENDEFLDYNFISKDNYIWWNALPTK